MLKSDKKVGIVLVSTDKFQENLEGLRKQPSIVKILSLYSNTIRNEARAAFKKYYKTGYNYKIIDNNDLLVQITTKDEGSQSHFHQYYVVPVKLKTIQEEKDVKSTGRN